MLNSLHAACRRHEIRLCKKSNFMLKQFKVQMTSLGTIHLSNYISNIHQEQMQFLSSLLFFSRGQKIFRIPWTNTVQFKGNSENSIQTSTSILNSHFSSCLYICKEKILNFCNFHSFIKSLIFGLQQFSFKLTTNQNH